MSEGTKFGHSYMLLTAQPLYQKEIKYKHMADKDFEQQVLGDCSFILKCLRSWDRTTRGSVLSVN
jgi:hypothetical protein